MLGTPTGDCCGGEWTHGAGYLGREHAGVRLNVGGREPAAVRHAARRPGAARGAGRRVQPARQAQPRWPASTIPTTRRCGPASSRTSWPSACRPPCPRRWSSNDETAETQQARTAWTTRRRSRSASSAWRRGGWSSAACASCRSSTAAAAAARGTPTADIKKNHTNLSAQVDQPIAGLLKDLKQPRPAGRHARRLGHRVRPHARRAGRRPRPSSARLLRLAGRRRHQGRRGARRDRRAGLPRRRESALRHRHPRHGAAPARPRPARWKCPAAGAWRSISASRSPKSWHKSAIG